MKILDEVYCGVQSDIPTAKECYNSIKKIGSGKGGWRNRKKELFQFGQGRNIENIEGFVPPEDLEVEENYGYDYDDEEENIIREALNEVDKYEDTGL